MNVIRVQRVIESIRTATMSPLGNLYGLPVIADGSPAEEEVIVFNARTHTDSVRMTF